MKELKIKDNTGNETLYDVRTEWSDWALSDFISLSNFIKLQPEHVVKNIKGDDVKLNYKQKNDIKFFYLELLKEFTHIPESVILKLPFIEVMAIYHNYFMVQVMAVVYQNIFCSNPEYEMENGQRLFKYRVSESFKKENYKEVLNEIIPAPDREIISIAQAKDFENSLIAVESISEIQSGNFEKFTTLAALYQVHPYTDEKVLEMIRLNANENMQVLLDFFVCTQQLVNTSLSGVQNYSIEVVNEPETETEKAK